MNAELAAIFANSFVLALSGALMPGPLLAAAISGGMRRGAVAGPLLMLGHGILELALILVLMLGLAPLLTGPTAMIIISLTGAGILLFMAWGMLRSLPTLSLTLEAEKHGVDRLVVSGALLSLANPYWAIWWATIGLGYMLTCQDLGYLAVAAFFVGHITADTLWYFMVTLAVSRGRRFMSDKVYRLLVGACAVALILFAGFFGLEGLRRLTG